MGWSVGERTPQPSISPSIILWEGVNESGPFYKVHHHEGLTNNEIAAINDEMKKSDSTRPIVHSGNRDVGRDTVNYHYMLPGGWTEEKGSIQQWVKLVRQDKPAGVGEFFQTRTGAGPKDWSKEKINEQMQKHQWWQGTWLRGVRGLGLTDNRTKMFLRLHQEPQSNRAELLRHALAPVALYDLSYDDFGIAPHRDQQIPHVAGGETQVRMLRLFNDDFRGESLLVEIELRANNQPLEAIK